MLDVLSHFERGYHVMLIYVGREFVEHLVCARHC